MNSVQSFFLITILLITALLALTVLLIVVTEQPDSMIEGRHRVVQLQGRGEMQLVQDEVAAVPSAAADGRDGTASQHHPPLSASIPSPATTVAAASSLLHNSSSSQFPLNSVLEKLAQFGPSDGGKFVGVQFLGDYLYLPKDDGRIEVRDGHRLVLIRTVSTGIRIHRLRAVNERIFVILDHTFGRLLLFDASSGTVLREKNLEEPAKELTLNGALVHTLSRFGTRIHSFELDDLRAVKMGNNTSGHIVDTDHQPNCNSISGDGTGIALFVSCGTEIIKLSTQGSLLQRFASPMGVNYSAFLVSRSGKLLVLTKAQRLVYLLDKNSILPPIARLHHSDERNESSSTSLWIWINLALDSQNGTLFILEYISNRVEVFKMTPQVINLL